MRWVRWVGVLATVAALAACDENPGTPAPPAGLNLAAPSSPTGVGPPLKIPYWADGELHLNGKAIVDVAQPIRILFRSPTIVVTPLTPDESPKAWWLVRERDGRHRLDRLPMTRQPQEPVLSADGRLIAWIDELDSRRVSLHSTDIDYRVSLYDVRRDRVVGSYQRTQRLTQKVKCCDLVGRLFTSGVTNDGRVALSTSGGWPELWRAGSDPVRLSRRVNIYPVQWPRGIMYIRDTGNLDEDAGAFARVGPRGRVRTLGWVRSYDGLWNSNGTVYAFTSHDDRTVGIDRIVDGRRHSTLLDLPTYNARWSLAGWEDAEHIVVDRFLLYGKSYRLKFARCHVVTATCQNVPDRPKDDTLVMLPGTD